MIKISQQQAYERWDTLPQVLRDALFADETTDFVWKTCTDEHIPEAKTYTVARLAGYVMFGFLHPEDFAKELRDALQIDIRIATAIVSAINARIFTPLRLEIDKAYKPVGSAAASVPMGAGPKMLEEIRPVVPVGARSSVGAPPRPAFSGTGWSKMSPQSVPPPVPASGAPVARSPVFNNLQKTEMGKISISSIPPPPAAGTVKSSVPIPPVGMRPAPAPMPIFMQSDAATVPLVKSPDLTRKSGDKMVSLAEPPKPPARPAVMEFGTSPKPLVAGAPVKSVVPRAVNYSEIPAEKGRQVSEMTDNTPKPPVIPAPPAAPVPLPPKPPTPPGK